MAFGIGICLFLATFGLLKAIRGLRTGKVAMVMYYYDRKSEPIYFWFVIWTNLVFSIAFYCGCAFLVLDTWVAPLFSIEK